jgi:hypothetical protein
MDIKFAGDPMNFNCGGDEYAIVEQAVRMIYSCQQVLSGYIRYPCPGAGFGGCTLDYNTAW